MLTSKNFVENFRNPPTELYPVPWWSWKGDMEYPEMIRQLDLYKEQNVHEFFIFAATCLGKPSFFSEEWFEYVEFTLKEAEKRNMKVWIYDDLNWPSGSCGGKLIKEYPELREFRVAYSSKKLEPGEFAPFNPVGLRLSIWEQDGVFTAVEPDEYGYFTNKGDSDGTLHFVHYKPMERRLLNAGATMGSWYQRGQLDLVNKKAFKLWVDTLYGEYERRFGKYFGTLIKGFFTDEPQGHSFDGATAPYNKEMRQCFIERYGYDPENELLKLFLNIPGAEEFRRNYFSVYTDLFSDNMKMLGEWCSERNLLMTGHCIFEEVRNNLQSFTLRNGDPHRLLKYFSAPGCDLLGHTTAFMTNKPGMHRKWANDDYINTVYTAKFVTSTARWSGADRTMCEAYGVRGSRCGLESQKLINDFIAGMGINLVNHNGLTYTIGELERIGTHYSLPWWHLFGRANECSARLSCFASYGYIAAKVAVMVPLTTIWSRTRPLNWTAGEFKRQAGVFNKLSMELLRNRIEFEYIFEDTPEADELKAFDYVILPATEFMDPVVAARLDKFRKNGGKVIAAADKPQMTDGSGEYKCDIFEEDFNNIIPLLPQAPYTIEGENVRDVMSVMRESNGEYVILIANQTEGVKKFTFKHDMAKVTEFMEVESGNIYNIPAADNSWVLTLEEGQSVVVRIAETASGNVLDRSKFITLPLESEKSVLTLDGAWSFDFGKENIFVPKLSLRYDPCEAGVKERWFENPPEEWFDVVNDELPINMCQEECMYYWMRGEFVLRDRVPENLAMVFSNATADKLYINGVEANAWEDYQVWDHMNRRNLIAPQSRIGKNEFMVRIMISRWNDPKLLMSEYQHDMTLATVVSGDFAVAADKSLIPPPAAIAADGWVKYGFECLPRLSVYRKTFEVADLPENPVLVIDDARSTVEVTLNGVELTPRCWKPFRFDLKDVLKKGANDIEIKVAGGFGNVLTRGSFGASTMTKPFDYGLMGEVRIVEFK